MTAEQGFELHPGAAVDITNIWEFVASDNPLAARRVRDPDGRRVTPVWDSPPRSYGEGPGVGSPALLPQGAMS
jgi:hypothetical protein